MINKSIIIGNVCADPEQRATQSGTAVTTFSVATSEKFKGADGQMKEETEFHRCVAWGRLAEICAEYLKKGSKVYCESKLKTRKWQDQEGKDRYTTEHVVREMKMLSPRDTTGSREQFPDQPAGFMGDTGEDDSIPF